MKKILEWGNSHKTALTGVVLIITGIVGMLTSSGDSTTVSNGWTQILGGLTAIFLQDKMRQVQNAAENVVPAGKIDALEQGEAVTIQTGSGTMEVVKVEPQKVDETVM